MDNSDHRIVKVYRNVVQGTITVGFGNLTLLILGLLTTMVAVRKLSQWDFGTFILLQALAALIAQLSSMGLDIAVTKFLAGAGEEREKNTLIHTVLIARVGIIVCFCVLYFLLHPWINVLFQNTNKNIVFPVLLLFSLQSIVGQLKAILQGLFRFSIIGIGSVIESICNFIFVICFILFAKLGLWGLILAKILAQGISCLYLSKHLSIKKNIIFDFPTFVNLFRFGFPLEINEILGFIYQKFDTILIGILMTPTQIAYLAVARKIPDSLSGLYEAFRSVYFPHITQLDSIQDRKMISDVLNQVVRLLAFSAFLLCLVAVIWGSKVITVLFTQNYSPSTPLFQIFMIGLSIGFVNNIFGTSLVALGQSNKPPLINTVHSITSLISNLILIPNIGILGAGLSNVLGNLISNPLNFYFLTRSKINVCIKNYVLPFIILFISVLPFLIIGVNHIILVSMVFSLYIGLSFLLSVITVGDLQLVLRVIPGLIRPVSHIDVNK